MTKEIEDLLELNKNNELLMKIFEPEKFSILKSWFNKNKSKINDESKLMLYEIISNGSSIIENQKKEIEEKKNYFYLYHKLKEDFDLEVKIEVEKAEKVFENKALKMSNELMEMIKEIENNALKEKKNLVLKIEKLD